MALTKKQRQLAGNIFMYCIVNEILSCDDGEYIIDEQKKVLTELKESFDSKIGDLHDLESSELEDIIDYVKQL